MTFIEVIMVMLIIEILAAVVVPKLGLSSISLRASADGAAHIIASDIRYLQGFAMAIFDPASAAPHSVGYPRRVARFYFKNMRTTSLTLSSLLASWQTVINRTITMTTMNGVTRYSGNFGRRV
jgi:hypothetical protein